MSETTYEYLSHVPPVYCLGVENNVYHEEHWHVFVANGFTVAQGMCPGVYE